MTKTPEGFLICHSVPIARTGTQEYYPRELGFLVTSRLQYIEMPMMYFLRQQWPVLKENL